MLGELSRSRAQQGFSATVTAVSVLALKDAVLSVQTASGPMKLREYIEYTRFVDEPALFTFETYAKAREQLIGDQAEQLLELSTPVMKL